MKIGVIACNIMRRELDKVLATTPGIAKVVYLEAALHCNPKKMRESIKGQMESIKNDVDLIFLGYGTCQSLEGLDREFDLPVVHPQMDDCISILFTPERYAEEIEKEAGT